MKIIGLDLGSKTCGIALSDKFEMLASPMEIYRFQDEDYQSCLNYITEYAKNNSVETIVLGYPKNMNNSIGERAKISENFKEMLEKFGLEVILWDERLTTKEVTRVMITADLSRKRRKKEVDKLAATIILQGYLDFKK